MWKTHTKKDKLVETFTIMEMFNKLRMVGLLNYSIIYSHNSSTTNTIMCLHGMLQQKLYSVHSENVGKINFSCKFTDTSLKV